MAINPVKNTRRKPQAGSNFSAVKSLARPDMWAVNMGLKVDARDFTLSGGEYVRDVIRDYSPEILIPKAAQMRFTVLCITRALHNVVIRKWNGLYLLPLKTGAVPFVQARIDPIIESNPTLKKEFTSVDNRLHKQTTAGVNLYIRGTNIERELQEIPVDFEVWDERDRMVDDNLEDARHRMDGSTVKQLIMISTPTVEGHGVYADDAWASSDQHRWEVPCPGCGRFQTLNFNDKELDYNNLKLGDDEKECVLECAYCQRVITDEERISLNADGRWTCYNLDGDLRGYYINQFNSPTQPLNEIMKAYYKGQTDQRKLKAFWQQNMGKPYSLPGDRLTPEILDGARRRGYSMGGVPASSLFVGIDVGNLIHVWLWHRQQENLMLYGLKTFREWGPLQNYLQSLGSWIGVIDAHPEKRAARDLCLKFHGRLWMGFEQDRDQQGEIAEFDRVKYGDAPEVKIDRTLAFDTFIAQYMNGNIVLPIEARMLGEEMPMKPYNGFYHQQLQMVRVEEENTKSQLIARWRKNKNLDHWHHAGMFATIATMQTPPLQIPAGLSSAMNRSVI